MSWKRLTTNDLRTLLSEDEVEKLTELATLSSGVDVQNAIDMVSDTWRGALQAKGVTIDVRDHYTPASYRYWILVHARWAVWTRFPGTPAYALDDARKDEYKKALEILGSAQLAAEKPDYSDDPELSGYVDANEGSILVPMQRFPDDLPLIQNFMPFGGVMTCCG